METINGNQLTPYFNFYTIVINKQNTIKPAFFAELENLVIKVNKSKKGIWLKIDESIYQKLDIKLLQLLQKEFKFYYNDTNTKCLIFVATKLKTYPSAPNTNIGTHLMIMTPDNNVLTSIENNGKGGTYITLPGGNIDLSDNDGIQNTLFREFGEEITKHIKINKKNLKLVTIRHIPEFQRLGNLYRNQDMWFLYKLELSKVDCSKIIKHFKESEKTKQLQLMSLKDVGKNVSWLSKDIIDALHCNDIDNGSNMSIYHSKTAYNDSEGYFFY